MINENELPKNWEIQKLGKVFETTSGGTPSRKNSYYYQGDIPWIKSGELDKGLITDSEEKITEEAIKNSSAKIFSKGTLLIALYGATIGKLAFLGIDAATNQAICGIFENEFYSSKFLFYFLLFKRPSLVKSSIGGAQPNISQTILKGLDLPIPPLAEQERIVAKIEELFSELDAGIESLKTAAQQLKTYRQAVLKWAFEGKLTNENVNEGELPNGWKWEKLNNLGELGRGKSKHRPRNDKKLFGGKYPFIQTGEVKAAGHIIKTFEKTYSDFGLSQSKLWKKGTLCITIAANIAETAFLGFDCCFPDSIVGFTPNNDLINAEYIFYFFKANQSRLESFAPATAQKNINLNTLENLILPYCSLEEQQRIVEEIESRLSVCDKLEETISQSLAQSESLRQSILKQAFEGKLVEAK